MREWGGLMAKSSVQRYEGENEGKKKVGKPEVTLYQTAASTRLPDSVQTTALTHKDSSLETTKHMI